jgi:hypothetical protein
MREMSLKSKFYSQKLKRRDHSGNLGLKASVYMYIVYIYDYIRNRMRGTKQDSCGGNQGLESSCSGCYLMGKILYHLSEYKIFKEDSDL